MLPINLGGYRTIVVLLEKSILPDDILRKDYRFFGIEGVLFSGKTTI
jgi:hypothetical protein